MTSVPKTVNNWNEVRCWADCAPSVILGLTEEAEPGGMIGNEGFVVGIGTQAAMSTGDSLRKDAAFLSGAGA